MVTDPYWSVVPYSTCPVAGLLTLHATFAEVSVIVDTLLVVIVVPLPPELLLEPPLEVDPPDDVELLGGPPGPPGISA